ncbi:hypothetical protein SAMN06273572_101498 [Monaibacterium marinum]|uniref:Peptidase propeptide and YPEB domain-containing protein n=1 Tax=Pontivivens marinum TaxID=1690039 RepID=A0A2C9CN76_9RHOB|nr:hypothetical protein [Monaibacterium marinum]SOH92650.1 hypothetical protein SAMN06273572_101498 [Monaibacterium marinum]
MTKFQTLLSSSLILFFAGVLAADAQAQTVECGPRNAAINALTDEYGEVRRAIGLDPRGIVEVYASDETGSWSVTVTLPDGRTCLLAQGEHWIAAPGPLTTGRIS